MTMSKIFGEEPWDFRSQDLRSYVAWIRSAAKCESLRLAGTK